MWKVEFLPKAVEEEAELPLDMRANLGRMAKVIGERGLLDLPPGWIKPSEKNFGNCGSLEEMGLQERSI